MPVYKVEVLVEADSKESVYDWLSEGLDRVAGRKYVVVEIDQYGYFPHLDVSDPYLHVWHRFGQNSTVKKTTRKTTPAVLSALERARAARTAKRSVGAVAVTL